MKFTDTEEVIDRANATEYGLAAGVFTKDITTATYVAHNLKGGTTWYVNILFTSTTMLM